MSLGYHTIFLGENIPLNNLKYINKLYDDIIYISYFTIKPSDNDIYDYLKIFSEEYLSVNKNSAKLIGHRIRNLNPENVPKNIMLYDKIEDLVKDL